MKFFLEISYDLFFFGPPFRVLGGVNVEKVEILTKTHIISLTHMILRRKKFHGLNPTGDSKSKYGNLGIF
jgi:hypothetical protein